MTLLDPQPVARTSVLRHRQFALLFAGQAVSQVGDRLVMVAMPFAVLSVRGADLVDVGLVLGASTLALGLFVLVGGVVADRLPRQRTMLASDVVRGLAQGVTAVLLLTGRATVLDLVLLQAVYGAAEAFFRPAALALVPQVVGPGEEQPANALLALAANSSMVVGPALAGVLVAVLGAGGALAVDAVSFGLSAASLTALRPRPVVREVEVTPGFGAQLAEGWREVRQRQWVWSVLCSFSAYHALVLAALFVLGPAWARDHRGGAAAWGLISAGFGVGAVLGSVVSLRWRPQRPGTVIAVSLALASTQAVIVVSPLPTLVVALLELLTGVCVTLCFTLWETALQERIPSTAQARVSSFDYLASVVLMPVGYVLVGPVADLWGTARTAAGATVVSLLVCLAVASAPGVRGLRPVVPLVPDVRPG